MKKVHILKNKLAKAGAKASFVAATTLGSASVFAQDYSAEIETAKTAATGNVGAAAAALIAVAMILFGLGYVVSIFSRR